MKDDKKEWKEVELPPLKAQAVNLGAQEPEKTRKATVDIRAVKFILQDGDGSHKIKFHDGEFLVIDETYKLEIF